MMKIEGYEVEVVAAHYADNGTLAVMLNLIDGSPFARLTVNIENSMANGEMAYVDVNNCPWAEQFILDNGLGQPTGDYGFSGYCIYPLYQFNLKQLRFIDRANSQEESAA